MLSLGKKFDPLDLGAATSPPAPPPLVSNEPVVLPWEQIGIPLEQLARLLPLWRTSGVPETIRRHANHAPFYRTELLQQGKSVCGDGPGATLLELATSKAIIDTFKRVTGVPQLEFSHIGINRIAPGSDIRSHVHLSYDYTAVMVLQLPDAGGQHFSIAGRRQPPTLISGLRLYDLIFESGDTFHGVTKVEGNRERISLTWAINGKPLGPIAELLGVKS